MSVGERRINGHLLARLLGSDAYQRPYYLSVARAIGGLILDGRLATRTRLPAERDLSTALRLSRNTVAAAYAWLAENGFVDQRRGSGSWTTLPETGQGDDAMFVPRADRIDLGVAAPPAIDGLREAVEQAVVQLPAHIGGSGYTLCGLPELRHAIARRYVERGLPTRPEQIFVTNGAQHALALLLELLLEPGGTLLLESPTYPHALDSPRRHDARIRTIGLGPEGWELELVTGALRQWRPHVAYLMPDFHNPTGALMDEESRAAVVSGARRAGTSIVVDESSAELAIDPVDQPPPMAGHDTDGRVFTVGSAAKLLWGGLRVGWIRTTPPMVARLMAIRQRIDLAGSVLDQITVARLLPDITRIRAERSHWLRRGRDTLAAAVRDRLPDWGTTVPNGGLVLWCELPRPVATALSHAASRRGVHLAPGPVFGTAGTLERYARLTYTQPPEILTDAVARIADAYAESADHPAPVLPDLYV